ncbi:hypothetical protein K469DRAFT_710520 [Zopfia rhizophila CBS 207.26]|uniref:FAD-binding FR-type domain-containing protein n=1 Tax=Zopfia rhizophila CBS 207.26 TaxID=1314779 RepID=A0A6A6DZJ1_9PEZI|nr:hypothetical protein K469DRAFT_710520 [Zopfia rhizophila CBS 207.26]
MYPFHSRRVEQPTSFDNILTPRGGLIEDIKHDDPLKFSHGLTGVDQEGNYLWVHVLLGCFALLCLGTLILRFFKIGAAHVRHMSSMNGPAQQAYWMHNHNTWWPWLKRHVFYAPFHHKRHNRTFQLSTAIDNGTLPGRFHTIILVVYCMSNVAYCLALPWDRSESASVVAALRGRSGTLAALNLIPTVLFALRNNPLIPLLRVSYDDFNLMHRWAARIVIVESVVHTLAWFFNTKSGGGLQAVADCLRTEPSYAWGMVGTVVFVFILFQAWAPIRHAFYETFLNIHRLVVLLGLIGVYVHIDTHMLPQLSWMQIIFTLWGMEWFFRVVRVVYYNMKFGKMSRITVEAMPGEAVRVTLDLVRPWRPRPGCHVHMYIPKLALWSSHPFSVAWSPTDTPSTPSQLGLPTSEKDIIPLCAPPSSTQISLICRARTGLTRKMYDLAATSPSQTFTTWGGIEGPYGGHHSLDSYGTVLLFAGGVGITHQVMYIQHLVSGFHLRKTATQKILLVWTVPDSECLEWVRPWMDSILRMPERRQCLRVMLFITRPKRSRLESASETVQMLPGRCDTQTILDKEIRERVGAMCVTVCGSGAFADDVRAAVRRRVEVGAVDFIEEAFTY